MRTPKVSGLKLPDSGSKRSIGPGLVSDMSLLSFWLSSNCFGGLVSRGGSRAGTSHCSSLAYKAAIYIVLSGHCLSMLRGESPFKRMERHINEAHGVPIHCAKGLIVFGCNKTFICLSRRRHEQWQEVCVPHLNEQPTGNFISVHSVDRRALFALLCLCTPVR